MLFVHSLPGYLWIGRTFWHYADMATTAPRTKPELDQAEDRARRVLNLLVNLTDTPDPSPSDAASSVGVVFGDLAGRDDRSTRPSSPRSWNRWTHTVSRWRLTPPSSATWEIGRRSRRTRMTSRRRPSGVRGAFAWANYRCFGRSSLAMVSGSPKVGSDMLVLTLQTQSSRGYYRCSTL